MIRARDLTVRRGSRAILASVSLRVAAGQVVALVGPNGAGKSTLLAALAGDLAVASGEIWLDGHPLGRLDRAALAARRAVLPQRPALVADFTAVEVVMLGQRRADRDAACAHLGAVGLAALIDRRYPTLSGGEQQRVQLARVLAQLDAVAAGALFLDEPTAALDPGHQHVVMRLAGRVAAAGHAVVVVLHDLTLAARYADRIVVLDRGRVIADGPPAQALDPACLRAAYGIALTVFPGPDGSPLVVAIPTPGS